MRRPPEGNTRSEDGAKTSVQQSTNDGGSEIQVHVQKTDQHRVYNMGLSPNVDHRLVFVHCFRFTRFISSRFTRSTPLDIHGKLSSQMTHEFFPGASLSEQTGCTRSFIPCTPKEESRQFLVGFSNSIRLVIRLSRHEDRCITGHHHHWWHKNCLWKSPSSFT